MNSIDVVRVIKNLSLVYKKKEKNTFKGIAVKGNE